MAFCDRPERIRNPKKHLGPHDNVWIDIPCGKCYGCLQKKCDEWVHRMQLEDKHSSTLTWFCTLTYDEENLPLRGCDIATAKTFTKALRDKYKGCKIYLISEYGPTTNRPHYHLVLFHTTSDQYEIIKYLQKFWKYGNIKCELVTPNRMAYCAGYHFSVNEVPEGQNKNFRLISKGIGKMTPEEAESIKRYKRFVVRRPDGYKQPLERYNFDKIYTNETVRHELKLQRQQIAMDIFKHESRNFTQLGDLQLWNDIKLQRRKKSKKHL